MLMVNGLIFLKDLVQLKYSISMKFYNPWKCLNNKKFKLNNLSIRQFMKNQNNKILKLMKSVFTNRIIL